MHAINFSNGMQKLEDLCNRLITVISCTLCFFEKVTFIGTIRWMVGVKEGGS